MSWPRWSCFTALLWCLVSAGLAVVPGCSRFGETRPSRRAPVLAAQPSASVTSVASARPAPVELDFENTALRVRVTNIVPSERTVIKWRTGGEGLGGKVSRGAFPSASSDGALAVGEYSGAVPLETLLGKRDHRDLALTITAGAGGHRSKKDKNERVDYSTDVHFEVQVLTRGQVTQTLQERVVNGGTLTLIVQGSAGQGFVRGIQVVDDIARTRLQALRSSPWAKRPLPERFSVISDLGGYGEGSGYAIRTADPAVPELEWQTLRELGVNGLRAAPDFMFAPGPLNRGRLRARVIGPVGYPVEKKKKGVPNERAGCAFDPGVHDRSQEIIARILQRSTEVDAESLWVLTADEIGSVAAQADLSNRHFSVCDKCAAGFRKWLTERGVRPADVGAQRMQDVRPMDVWKRELENVRPTPQRGRLAQLSFWFRNHASASAFTEIRDGFAKANQEKLAAMARGDQAAARRPFIYSYGLRANTFLMGGTNLDFFEFYRHADNAMVWETSNRDARIWGWDSYLTDVQRVLKRELGLQTGIYIKPHRGAPLQRMLAAVSRGDELIYWYTYGPDYWKGDAFSGEPKATLLASRAAHLLGASENALFGAKLAAEPRVAVVRTDAMTAWMFLEKQPEVVAANESSKWVYTALQHAHVPVDPLDERFVTELDLSRYSAIYVSGTHVGRATLKALELYVSAGGTLVTSGYGLAYDETGFPYPAARALLGLKGRGAMEQWCTVESYNAGRVGDLDGCEQRHRVLVEGAPDLALRVGREVLQPTKQARVLARYEDGGVAATEHQVGRGRSIVLGYYAGLEYAAPILKAGFDMRRDLSSDRRRLLVEPALRGLQLSLDVSDPLVEAVLLKSAQPGSWAITLANWAYADQAPRPEASGLVKYARSVPLKGLRLTLRGLAVSSVRSVELERSLPLERTAEGLTVVVPELSEGDVLVLGE